MQGNHSRTDIDQDRMPLPALIAVVLVSLMASALITSIVLIASDRLDRPSMVVTEAGLPTIAVQIDGAIATPGVYQLPSGARLNDLVQRAGGLTAEADVASLNLAARVGDGERVRIPPLVPVTRPEAIASPATSVHLVNVNTASAADLAELPGIGPVLSERIVAYRDINGPFTSLDQLANVEGISAGLVEKLRALITLDV